jgi:NADH-quinone oxidoreductase subunit A
VTKVADTTQSKEAVQEPISELGFTVEASTLQATQEAASDLAVIAFVDLLVFFGVVLVGFIYLWKRGDLDWVRAIQEEQQAEEAPVSSPSSWSSSPASEPARTEAGAAV